MTNAPERKLEVLAGALADDTPVDWAAAAAEADPAEARTIRGLHSLALIAAASRPSEADDRALFRWGPLQAIERIGQGSFGEVFRAFDPTLGREVALKLRLPAGAPGASAARWLAEARRLARVRHPNVLVVHGAAVHDDRAGLWTDLVDGRTLEELLAERGAFGAREAALVGIELCGALAAVHAAGLVHGDVKTRNVVREGVAGAGGGSGRIVLMDFGSASELSEGGGSSFGTPLSTAPEVLEGAPATAAADLYALGVLLYRLVTLRYPVEADSLDALRARHRAGERTSLRTVRPDLPLGFVQVVERAIAPEPGARFADAADFERALAGTLMRPAVPSRRVAWVAAGLIVVAVAGFALWRSTPSSKPVTATVAAPSNVAPATVPAAPTLEASTEPAAPEAPAVTMSLERLRHGVAEPLRSGDRVAPGDRLFIELSAAEPVHAYVLNEDEHGAVFVLFPLAGSGARNPLSARATHRLPGKGAAGDLDWQVTSAGGSETFLVLAVREPLPEIDRALAAFARPALDAGVTAGAPADDSTRGVGSVTPRPQAGAGGRLLQLRRRLERSAAGERIWMKLLVLENPVL
jgi:hypothetical protein